MKEEWSAIDPIWYRATTRQQRLREKQDLEYVIRQEEQNRGKTYEDIEAMMVEHACMVNYLHPTVQRVQLAHLAKRMLLVLKTPQFLAEEVPPLMKKRKLFNFKASHEKDLDNMPLRSVPTCQAFTTESEG